MKPHNMRMKRVGLKAAPDPRRSENAFGTSDRDIASPVNNLISFAPDDNMRRRIS